MPDGHHLRRAFTLFIQHVKASFPDSIKLLGGIKPRAVAKRIVRVQRVGARSGAVCGCAIAAGPSVQKGKSSP